jgi:squalene-hopene/tetraprenyl-beta-curcumene cyclase
MSVSESKSARSNQNSAEDGASEPLSHKAIKETVRRSQEFLLGEQTSEGYWVGELLIDATLVSDTICFNHWRGKVDEEWQRKAVNHILSLQLDDGGWNIYHHGPPEVNATIKAYLALKLAGVPETDKRMLKAREVAVNLGGVPRMNTFSKLYLALLGLFPWKYVPTIPCEIILIGKWFHVNFHEMSNWTRGIIVPLSIINHFKPTRKLKNPITIDELYPEGYHERDLLLPRDPEMFTWRNLFLALDKLHKFAEKVAHMGLHPFRKRALKKSEEWMLERFEGSSGLGAIWPAMLNSLIALKALGYADDHPQVLRAERELKLLEHETEDSVRIEPCLSPVWDTAIASVCLASSGVPKDHPKMRKAADYLIKKEIRFRGDWKYKNPTDVEPSGWAFEHENKFNPDVDDSAMVILALRKMQASDESARKAAIRRGVTWIKTFQCKDGGWAAFDKDCTMSIMEKVPFADHNAMLDPECADITARILEMLGEEGYRMDDPQVAHAVKYIKGEQELDGSWYGRWGVNYLYGTWAALRGMRALNLDMTEPWLQKGKKWLESVQLEDGGWGERCNTYDDPVYKGTGPSTPSQTAWAVMGLCAFDDPTLPSLKRGIQYLINAQAADGSWPEDETTGTGFPKVFYLKYSMYRNAWPLLALSTYQDLLEAQDSKKQ